MQLILWRHAEAAPGTPDEARPLTETGRLHAQQMAQWLRARLPSDLLILSSPAVRARQTAEALGLPFSLSDALAKNSSAEAMRDAAGWPDNARNVILVGHQPVLGDLLMLLLGAATPLDAMPKAGLWWLSAQSSAAQVLIGVKAVIGPDSLQSAGV
ncbi:MAG: histidine phosphatase family protein [Oxalobacteraceae bacterium]|nr:MAG: histidine phosphatase family protein [Oxalobacteraceae bacterium]